MCASCEAAEARKAAATGLLLAAARFTIGEPLKHAFPVDPEIPPYLREFLKKL